MALAVIGTAGYFVFNRGFGLAKIDAPAKDIASVNGSLAQCLSSVGAVMYGSDTCPHCLEQKNLFGTAFAEIKYVNCDFNAEACRKENVQYFPMWVIKGKTYLGVQNFNQLSQFSGCAASHS